MTVRLVVFGRQGAGKGTQCQKLAAHYGVPHISTGDLLRLAVAEGTEVGLKAKEYLDAGTLLPDEAMGEVVADRLVQPDAVNGFLLDGFPRTLHQAEVLYGIAGPKGIDLCIDIAVPVEVVRARMLDRGREDDAPEVIDARLAAYETETVPVIERYRTCGTLVSVDGIGEIDEVFNRLVAIIDDRTGGI